jgi:deferrochelatase/peroxidase EfeB
LKLTRRRLLGGAAAAIAVGGAGIYGLVERLTAGQSSRRGGGPRRPEQHLVQNTPVVLEDGVEILVPPLHHRVVTGLVMTDETPAALAGARLELERALTELETRHPDSSTGLTVTIAWGLPYFRRFVSAQARRELPVDLRATGARDHPIHVLEDAERFPSDPEDTILEDNEIAVLLRSDHLDALDDAEQSIFHELAGIFAVTSVRNGVVGGGFDGKPSLPKQMLTTAGIPGGALMPRSAELFLGFTSTVKQSLGPSKIANLETLGYADLRSSYFVGGTHMHLSHLEEDVLAWYLNFDRRERVGAMFRPGFDVAPRIQTVRQAAADAETAADMR